MALSYFTENEAPRDFRVSSTESDGHYKKCLLCYTVKKNFYCPECIRTGNFVHSSMPYSDRFSEKQAKLLRLKANRRHVLDRCERMLSPKLKRDTLLTECKQSRDKIDLLKLAIEQRRTTIEEKRKELTELVHYNNELRLKLPRYQKRVSSLGKHSQVQRVELQNRVSTYGDQTQSLAALRRSRIRQLTKYIFPVYMTYDSSDSIEDMEFVGGDAEEEPQKGCQLHIGAPWISADGDFSQVQTWGCGGKESALAAPGGNALHRSVAALGLAAQLVALLAATLDVRPPHPLALHEYCNWHVSGSGLQWRARRLCACVAALCARSGVPPPSPPGAGAPLAGVDALCLAAAADAPPLGRVEAWTSDSEAESEAWAAWAEAWCAGAGEPEDAEPEHLLWPEGVEMELPLPAAPPAPPAPAPAPPPSLVTSTVASIASIWRGWTK